MWILWKVEIALSCPLIPHTSSSAKGGVCCDQSDASWSASAYVLWSWSQTWAVSSPLPAASALTSLLLLCSVSGFCKHLGTSYVWEVSFRSVSGPSCCCEWVDEETRCSNKKTLVSSETKLKDIKGIFTGKTVLFNFLYSSLNRLLL